MAAVCCDGNRPGQQLLRMIPLLGLNMQIVDVKEHGQPIPRLVRGTAQARYYKEFPMEMADHLSDNVGAWHTWN